MKTLKQQLDELNLNNYQLRIMRIFKEWLEQHHKPITANWQDNDKLVSQIARQEQIHELLEELKQ